MAWLTLLVGRPHCSPTAPARAPAPASALQVKHNLVCSPFCIISCAAYWFPQGWRGKQHSSRLRKLGEAQG